MIEQAPTSTDWSIATWQGATREAMRRWAELPLERIVAAQEEMRELAEALGAEPAKPRPESP